LPWHFVTFFVDWRYALPQMIIDAIEQVGGIFVITADHGNAEDMVKRDKSGKPLLDKNGNLQILTSHTLQPVSNK
jgi:2,3-bisphosphoglycerate-independent phosphoglycerate mutase